LPAPERPSPAAFVAAHPWLVLALLAGITAAALAGLGDPRAGAGARWLDPSLDALLPREDEERVFYERMRRLFGSDEAVLVALEGEVFTAEGLARVERLSERLRALPRVERVVSLSTVPHARADAELIDVRPFTEFARDDPAGLPRLRAEALANPLYRGTLVSEDARTTILVVHFERMSDSEFLESGLAERIAAEADAEVGPARARITGSPVLKAATAAALQRQLAFALPGILAVGALVLWAAFASLRGVVLPLAMIAVALAWTAGTLAWLERPLNLVTSLVPPLVITVGLAYAIHVVAEFDAVVEAGAETRADAVRRTLAASALPVSLNGITTCTGLLALALSPLPAIREFGIFASAGVAYAALLSIALVPAALGVGPPPRVRRAPAQRLFARAAERLGSIAVSRRRAILTGCGLVLAVAIPAIGRIEEGTRYVGDFPPEARVRRDYEAVDRAFGGANPFYVVLEGAADEVFTDPAVLREIDALQEWLEAQPEIGVTTSIVDHLRLLNFQLHGDPAHLAIPADRRLAKQLLVFGGGEGLDGYVDARFRTANVVARASVDDTAGTRALLARIEARLAALPALVDGRITGNSVLLSRTVDRISSGQAQSLLAAMVVIWLILSALFTSLRVGALALLPNVAPIALYYGALGLFGVPLNPSTSLIACIALGITVDDTIHYLTRFNAEVRRTADEVGATFRTLAAELRPATFTFLSVCAGFLVLTTSELSNQAQFGWLGAGTLAIAWVFDVLLTPALFSGIRVVTLWDVLRLDLGARPQDEVPLLRGLSLRQARVFALLSDLLELRAGESLIREGTEGRDLYVVIGGELSAWVERDGARVELNRMARGEVIGEVGLFASRRSANVDAISDAKLLRFDEADLERLTRRSPRIAARIYRNLSRAQAARLARVTERVR
jgi:predicted RND superfamily exporter protein